jgi:L-threonylcarbamoyladenylate synthase
MTAPATNDLARAVGLLKRGGVVALPTDTLYALAALATDEGAVRRVYRMKGREDGKPLPLFVSGIEMASQIAHLTPLALQLAGRFWPGALTIVAHVRDDFRSEALAGGDTVALRVPDSEIAVEVVKQLNAPLTATSANRSGGRDPVAAEEVRRQLDDEVDFVLDTGPCPGGISSTIVDCTRLGPSLLRRGAIAEAEIIRASMEP